MAGRAVKSPTAKQLGWALLLLPLGLLLWLALTYDRAGWRQLQRGEATALMQAESLAFDVDLRYERLDFDRQVLGRYGVPTDLELISASEGRHLTYDRPAPYAVWLAPFVRWRPDTGFAVANVLLLGMALLLAARQLSRSYGAAAVGWISLAVFASAAFHFVFFAQDDSFLFSWTLLCFLLLRRADPAPRHWLWAGVLLALPIAGQPLFLVLLIPALWAAPRRDAAYLRLALGLGTILGLLALAVAEWLSGGGLLFGLADSFRYTAETGFPLVDFGMGQWQETMRQLQAFHFEGAAEWSWGLDARLWAWNLVYLLLGAGIGWLPYFFPAVLVLAAPRSRWRSGWLLAAAVLALALLIWRPFDLSAGVGMANRMFLPLYAAAVPLIAEFCQRPRRWRLVAMATTLLVAMVFISGMWRHAGEPLQALADKSDYPQKAVYPQQTAFAKALLPYELSQQTLPGGEILESAGLRLRPLGAGVVASRRPAWYVMPGAAPLELWVASGAPLDVLRFEFGPKAPSQLEVEGGEVGEMILGSDSGIAFRILPNSARSHVMWWSPHRQWLYRLVLSFPTATEPIRFRVLGERVPEE